MIYEINQIKLWLAKTFDLRIEGSDDFRIIDPVPDGDYQIPVGRNPKLTRVVVKDGSIAVDP